MATKAELLATALDMGLDAKESMTKPQLQSLIDSSNPETAEESAPEGHVRVLMNRNVKHGGVFHKCGEHVIISEKDAELFAEKGFIEGHSEPVTAEEEPGDEPESEGDSAPEDDVDETDSNRDESSDDDIDDEEVDEDSDEE